MAASNASAGAVEAKKSPDLSAKVKRVNPGLSRKETDRLAIAFDMFDTDKDGTIGRHDVKLVLQRFTSEGELSPGVDVGIMLEQFQEDYGSENNPSTPRVGFTDFKKTMKRGISQNLEEDMLLKDSFQLFDTDKDGFISQDELKENIAKFDESLTDAEIDEIFREADQNRDGKIDLEEYLGLMDAIGSMSKYQ